MAYEEKPSYLEEEDKDKEEQMGQGFVQQTTSAPGGTLTAGGATAPKAEAPTAGAGVTDINKYLDANREKIQALGQDVSGVIRGDYDTARTGLTSAGDRFKQDVAGGTVNMDQGFFNTARQNLTDQANYQTGGAGSFLGNQENVDRFKRLYGAKYTGPQDIVSQDYYQPAYTEAQKAIRTKGLVDEGTGRQELIARARPSESGRYSKGALTLDEALLSGDQATIEAVRSAAGEGDIQDRLKALKAMAAQEVLTGQQTSASTQEAMKREFDLGREEQEITSYADQVKANAQAAYEAKMNELQGISEEGISATSYYDPNRYSSINKYNVASSQDYARLKALEELTGISGTYSPYQGQAGQYSQFVDPNAAYNESAYASDVGSARTAREQREAAQRAYEAEQKRLADEAAQREKEAQAQQTGTLIGATAGGIAGSTFGPIGTAVGVVVGGAIGGAIGGVFCFDPETLVVMYDETVKYIKDIKLGDHLLGGGEVYTISSHLNNSPMYDYEGVFVTGSHAVKEDKWVRVKDSKKAVISDHISNEVVSLSCEKHIIISNDIVFADYDEVDNAQGLTDDQCLKVLNQEDPVYV